MAKSWISTNLDRLRASLMPVSRRKLSIASVLATLLLSFVVLTVFAAVQAKDHDVWQPGVPDGQWVNGLAKGYVEGQAAVITFEVSGTIGEVATIDICVDLDRDGDETGAYGFTGIVAPDDPRVTEVPTEAADGGAWPPAGYSDLGPIWGVGVTVTNFDPLGQQDSDGVDENPGGGGTCPENYLAYRVEFTMTSDTGRLYYAGVVARPGDGWDNDGDGDVDFFVPVGEGASAVGGNFQAIISPVTNVNAGAMTLPFAGADINDGDADLALTKTCPTDADFSTTPPPYKFTIVVDNASTGNSAAFNITDIKVTDTFPATILAYDSYTAKIGGIDAGSCALTNPGEVTCTLPSPQALNLTELWTIELFFNVINPAQGPQLISNSAAATIDPIGNYTIVNTGNDSDTCSATTPVTVSYFQATPTEVGTRFDWTTSTETGNAGFNLYVQDGDTKRRMNEEIIPSAVIDSLTPQDYSLELVGVAGEVFYIEDVSIFGEVRWHGPFELNAEFGERQMPEAIDWAAVTEENALALRQQTSTFTKIDQALRTGRNLRLSSANASVIELHVKEEGIYRLTYEELKSVTGIDLAGTSASSLALTNRGVPVPIFVSASTFGPGTYIEFIGSGLDTLYTDTNVYRLEVNSALSSKVAVSRTRMPRNPSFAPSYMETVIVEDNSRYNYRSPIDDPYYGDRLDTNQPKTYSYQIPVDNLVASGTAQVAVDVWGRTEYKNGPEHHMTVGVNSEQVASALFDSYTATQIVGSLPAANLVNGKNALQLSVLMDQAEVPDNKIAVESYSLSYPRAFVAKNDRLSFEGTAEAYRIAGLNSNKVVAYRIDGGRPARLNNVEVEAHGGTYRASFPGGSDATYFVSTEQALLVPTVKVVAPAADITSGSADLLIISHPDFLGALQPLVQARKAEGYVVKLVNVHDVYAHYSGGVFDALAIKEYITYAINSMGVDYIILGGGDTSDYHGYLGNGSVSFIPSLYAPTIQGIRFAPVDPKYADVDDDGVPDAAIGRFPARTVTEMQTMVERTLVYSDNLNPDTVVFAADSGFEGDSDAFSTGLPASWAVDQLDRSALGDSALRSAIINELNASPRVFSFVGHSSPYVWTNQSLYKASDAAAMSNEMPTLITQWGCFNTYYVDATYSTLADKFLFGGDNGAALVTGSTTLTLSVSERALGSLLMPKMLQPGITVGSAMQSAKFELSQTRPDMVDVLYGWTILGDPTLVALP